MNLSITSCTTPPAVTCRYPEGLLYAAALDSLGLEPFEQLATTEQADRRRQAAAWRARARKSLRIDHKLSAWHNAVGLAPDHTGSWLELAELVRWVGAPEKVEPHLQAAQAALRYAPPAERELLQMRTALAWAWHHYDRGEWRKGLQRADQALAVEPTSQPAMLIRGLLLAGFGRSRDATFLAKELERLDFFQAAWRWVRAFTEMRQGRLEEALHLFGGFRPEPIHRAECWRDFATLEEMMGRWQEARRRYERSFSSLPLGDRACIARHAWRPRQAGPDDPELPVWLAFDRFYVTGSIVGYAALAIERFENATQPVERQFWAEALIDAAGTCIRKGLGFPWARAWRGRVFAQLDLAELAVVDLQRAVAEMRRIRSEDPLTTAWYGHVLLRQGNHAGALAQLRQAARLDTTRARTWSDLGLALIMTEDVAAGRTALDRALALDPSLAVAWYNRGLMHYHAQRWDEAVADLQRAAELAPQDKEILSVLQRASRLRGQAAQDEE